MKSTRPDDFLLWWDEPLGCSEAFAKMISGKLEGKLIVLPTRTIDFRRFYD